MKNVIRYANMLGAVTCFSLIAVAYFYMENTLYLNPCPLCYAQRIVIGMMAVFFVLAAMFSGAVARKFCGGILVLLAIGGAALSIRHVYLQYFSTDKMPSCGQDFYGLVENTPFAQVVQTMLTGSGDCAEIQWTLLGISIPGWTLVAFVGLGLWALFFNFLRRY